jgi:hypothetical protein
MFRAVLMVVIAAMVFSGCTKDHALSSNCQTCPDTVYFHANVIPILNQYCALSGCHSGSGSQKGVDLDSTKAYATLTQIGPGYVNPGNTVTSVLLSELNPGTGVNQHMPPSSQLDPCTIQEIYCWIQQGAPHN